MFDEFLLNKIHQYIWFDKIQELNNEYFSHRYFVTNFWNYRTYYGEYENIIWNIGKFGIAREPPIEPISYVVLPERYYYSSGSNNPNKYSE